MAGQKFTELRSHKPQPILRDFEKVQRANQQIKQVRAELGTTEFSRRTFQQNTTITTTQRNPIALFGAGLIDSIPERVIEEAAKKKFKEFPEIQGRVCRLKDGRIGRFGWKAQKASLYDFAMTACAVELGLHVPDHPQSGLPLNPEYKPTGLDMNQTECNALVDYLKALPVPIQTMSSNKKEAEYLSEGRHLFSSTGCAACHTPQLGEVAGIYSDLLLHDIGQDMVDTGEYGVFLPSSSPDEDIEKIELPLADAETSEGTTPNQKVKTKTQIVGARRAEWRTPPLWGIRDSAPYLHDGRAQTLKQAIAFHGGEGKDSAIRFFSLTPQQQQQIVAFLKSLTAPGLQQPAAVHSEKLLSRTRR
ncbi:MAG: c-type cytochrome [Planctomycetes bacterium]|nr:c-type cytochrome [Planctomycetota bacterium]